LGWFKKELNTPADLRGLKYRTVGLAEDLNREMGVAVTILPGGEIVPAIERILRAYLALRLHAEESFLEAYRRLGMEPFKRALYGDEGHQDAA
jgi:hypothetical protein